MWLLTSEPQSAWLVLSHDPRRHRQSSGSTNLLVPEHAVPSILLFFLQPKPNRQRSTSHYQPISVFIYLFFTQLLSTGTALGLHPYPSYYPRPQQKRQGKSTTTPSNQPPSNFISPTFASRGKSSLQFDLPHHQSGFLASFLSCPNPPK